MPDSKFIILYINYIFLINSLKTTQFAKPTDYKYSNKYHFPKYVLLVILAN